MTKIIIIGAGFAGIGAANYLSSNNIDATIFEKEETPLNHQKSNVVNEFIFDQELPILSTQDESFDKLRDEKESTPEHLNIRHFIKGCSIKHPPIENLHGLPKDLVIRIVTELSELKPENEKRANNLKEWLYATFGKTYTDSILEKLIQKTYTLPSEKIDFSEIRGKFEQPPFEEILSGALTNTKESSSKRKINKQVPKSFSTFIEKIISDTEIEKNHKIVSIDTEQKIIFFENGKKENYDYLISSIPLPELENCLVGVPGKIKLAAKKLAFTNCVTVTIGIERKQTSQLDCAYFYDNDIIFSKLIFSHSTNKVNSHGNYENIQAVIYFSQKYKPLYLSPNHFIEPVIGNLKRCGFLEETDKILYKEANLIPFVKIIYDFDRPQNLSIIHKYLDGLNIFYCGRYGMWTNLNADESFENGANTAKKVKDILNLKTEGKTTPK